MKVIGLCGGSGSGKGLVSAFFTQLGIKCIDTDKVYHSIITEDSECTMELVSHFGNQIYANPGINRQELRERAFASCESLDKLNEITHRHILNWVREEIRRTKNAQSASGIIIDAPLLFESGFDRECDATVAVIADSNTRIERIILRDSISREDAKTRIASQIPNEKLSVMCDFTIENNSTPEALKDRVYELKKILFD